MQFNVEEARKEGYTDDEILAELLKTTRFDVNRLKPGLSTAQQIDYLSKVVKKPEPEAQPPQSLLEQARNSQFAQNFAGSFERFAGDIGHAVMNPRQTAEAALSIPAGVVAKMVPGPDPAGLEQPVDAMVDFYTNRYGSPGQAANTFYTDPVGAMADVSTLAGLSSAALRGASVPARMLGATRVANAAEQGARGLGVVQQATDPMRVATGILTTPLTVAGVPELLYQSAMKPRPSLSKERGRVDRMVQTGHNERLPISSGGVEKGWNLIESLDQQVQSYVDDAARRGLAADPQVIASYLDKVRDRLKNQMVAADDLEAIDRMKAAFLAEHQTTDPVTGAVTTHPIPVDKLQAMKQGTYRKLQGKYGKEATDANVEGMKALARGANEQLRTLIPEITEPNVRNSKLLDFVPELQRSVSRINNWDWIGFSTPAVATAAYGMTGSKEAATAAAMLYAVLGRPQIKSRLALGIYYGMKGNPGKYGPANMATATSRVDEIVKQLEQQAR